MLFQSATYFLFLPVCVVVFWSLPQRWRMSFLLVASYVFYASWSVPYAALVLALVVFNWGVATRAAGARRGPAIIGAAVAVNIALLGFFKYAGFAVDTVSTVAPWLGLPLELMRSPGIVQPLGISFFTFEFVHVLVDARRGLAPQCSLMQFNVFATFFPTQIAGPIKRLQDFRTQLERLQRPTLATVSDAGDLIVRGLFKKMLLADNLAPIADAGFSVPGQLQLLDAWTAVLAFTFQIYFDFAGYTDIARGSALLLGFRIPLNFKQPYLARNVSEFWERWHISLSQWLRDYLFIPLGGSRRGRAVTARNLLITMLLGGLWHGAAWHFVAWGGYWGVLLVGYHQWRGLGAHRLGWLRRLMRIDALAIAVTFVAVAVGWCLFRVPVPDALQVIGALFRPELGLRVVSVPRLAVVFGLVGAYYAWSFLVARLGDPLELAPAPVRGAVLAVLLVLALIAEPQAVQPFIYFQF